MKELNNCRYLDMEHWFNVEIEQGKGGSKGKIQKMVGQYRDGKLCLCVSTPMNHTDSLESNDVFFEIDFAEYVDLLCQAIRNGHVSDMNWEMFIKKAKTPFVPPWDMNKDIVVYSDGTYTLGQKNQTPYVIANGKTYSLSFHGYEPCLYVHGPYNSATIHTSFDPYAVLHSFQGGHTVTSITGHIYNPREFCRLIECACGDISISEAERLL